MDDPRLAVEPQQTQLIAVALAAHAAGLSVLPPHPTEKRPRLDWLQYQSEQMPVEQLRAELSDRLGIVTGFGNVECIDFDLAGFACIAWRERVEAGAPGLVARLYVERSPSGGRHVIYRCPEIASNTKLATFRLSADVLGEQTVQRLEKPLSYTVTDTDDGRMVTIGTGKPVKATKQRNGRMAAKICPIETRGSGGWLIVAPSPGYVIERGSLADLPEITPAERQVLIDAAVSLSDAEPTTSTTITIGTDSGRPGDIYNASGDHVELLTRNGWSLDHTEGQNEHWTRPGKDSGTSATWHTGKRTFYLFSSSVGELAPEQGHSLFAVRTALEHAGDLSACARAIRAEQRPVAAPAPTTAEQTTIAWPELIPLELGTAPAIDPAVVGGVLGDMAGAVAASIEVPPELPLGVGLAVASSVVARHYHVEMSAGYIEPLVIWSAAVERSGGRKSATSQAMSGPLMEWEARQHLALKHDLAKAQVRAEVLRLRVRDLTAKASKLPADQIFDVLSEIEDAQRQIEESPAIPRRVVQDVTPERVATMLAEHGEVLLMASDEGGLFDQFAGRYNAKGSGPNLDVWLQSHAGAPVRVDRKIGAPVALERPRLAVSVMPQPSLVAQLQAKDGFRGRGLLARFCWWMPRSLVGFRTFHGRAIDPAAVLGWRNALASYLDRPDPTEGTAGIHPSPEALARWLDFCHEVEPRQKPGCDLAHMSDWCSKSTGLVARIAGVLHALAVERPEHAPISGDTMAAAVALVRLLIEHAKAAFATMKADEALEVASAIWAVVGPMDRTQPVSGRDVHRALRGTYATAEDLAQGWAVLVARGYVRPVPPAKGLGRPPVRYEVNPQAGGFVHIVQGSLDTILGLTLSPNSPTTLSAQGGHNGHNSDGVLV